MNFFDVTVNQDTISDGKGFEIALTEGQKKLLESKGYMGKEVTFGIRPEDISSAEIARATFPSAVVEATVEISELLGSDSVLYCKTGNQEFASRVNARDYLAPGQHINLTFNVAKGHFFDKETTERIEA